MHRNGSSDYCAASVYSSQINLATPTTSAQLINRAQCVSSAPTSIPRQAVLLGNACSQALTASQAQMYLRAQMVRNWGFFAYIVPAYTHILSYGAFLNMQLWSLRMCAKS